MAAVELAVIFATTAPQGLAPASASVAPELLPLPDRDGLLKPVIQVLAEDAIAGGARRVLVLAEAGRLEAVERHFRAGRPGTLAGDRLIGLGGRVRVAQWTGDWASAATEAGDGGPVVLMRADRLLISATVDGAVGQAIAAMRRHTAAALSLVRCVHEQDLGGGPIVAGRAVDARHGVYEVAGIARSATFEEAARTLATPGLPAGNYLSLAGVDVVPAAALAGGGDLVDVLGRVTLPKAAVFRGSVHDLSGMVTLLEAQLSLALVGTRRADTCEMIARVLAGQIRS